MARMRTLKPQFFLNEGLAEIEPIGRLLFQGLWCLADREGRLEDRPRRIKAEVLPYDDVDVDGLLDQLGRGGFIERYDVGGSRYILISTFTKHQSPHCKEAESIIPAPGEHHSSTVQAPGQAPGKHDTSTVPAPPVTLTVPETVSDPGVDTFGGDTHRERMAPVASAAPTHGALALDPSPAPQLTTPQLTTPQPAVRAPARSPAKLVPLASISSSPPKRARAPDLLWDACVTACDGDGKGPSNNIERGKWNKGLAALRQSGATPEEISIRAARYRRRYGLDIALNPMSLASNWSILAQEVTHHAANNHGSSAARRFAGPGGRRSARTPDNLPDADELIEWARREQARGVNIIGL